MPKNFLNRHLESKLADKKSKIGGKVNDINGNTKPKYTNSLLEILSTIPDSRRKQGKMYKLEYVLFYSILAILCGATSYVGIVSVLTIKLELLNRVFGTKWKKPPGVSTLFYVFKGLDTSELEKAFRLHSKDLLKNTGKGLSLAIDGKALRGTELEDDKLQNVISIFETQSNLILAHFDSTGKGNELKNTQELLKEINLAQKELQLPKNSIIQTDALHTQKKL